MVDRDSTQRCLANRLQAWGAPPLNASGLHLEQSARAEWPRKDWLEARGMLERGAYKTAQWCRRYNIPIRWMSVKELRHHGSTPKRGAGGITSHANVSDAWNQSSHWDPGEHFPRAEFMDLVREFHDRHD